MLVRSQRYTSVLVGEIVREVTVLREVDHQLDGLTQRRPDGQHEEQRQQSRSHADSLDARPCFVKLSRRWRCDR